jgi:hypothetical protein
MIEKSGARTGGYCAEAKMEKSGRVVSNQIIDLTPLAGHLNGQYNLNISAT